MSFSPLCEFGKLGCVINLKGGTVRHPLGVVRLDARRFGGEQLRTERDIRCEVVNVDVDVKSLMAVLRQHLHETAPGSRHGCP